MRPAALGHKQSLKLYHSNGWFRGKAVAQESFTDKLLH